MIVGRFYTTRTFDGVESTVAFLREVTSHPSLPFDRFTPSDPDAPSYDLDDVTEPAKALCGYPVHTDGEVTIEGDSHAVSFEIEFHVSDLNEWVFTAEDGLFEDSDRIESLVEYFTEICVGNDVLFAGVDHETAWERAIGEVEGSSNLRDVLHFEHRFPDVYWFSYFGAGIFETLQYDVVTDDELLESEAELEGGIVSLGPSPLAVDENAHESRAVKKELGEAYFLAGTSDGRQRIEKLESIQGVLAERAEWESIIPYLPPETAASFEREIQSVDGEVFVNPEELAEVLVVYLHEDIEEVFEYDDKAIKALNEYFRTSQERWLYTAEHLEDEFIPALGAYLGEVLTRELPLHWNDGAPVMARTLTAPQLEPTEISPFHLAHHIVYHEMELMDFYGYLRNRL